MLVGLGQADQPAGRPADEVGGKDNEVLLEKDGRFFPHSDTMQAAGLLALSVDGHGAEQP